MKNFYFNKLFIFFILISLNTKAQTPFWSNDFSNASDWTMVDLLNGGLQNWVITTNGPQGSFSSVMGPIASTTAANGFALFDSDFLNASYSPQQASLTYNGTVDCSQYQYVSINFECYHRVFRDSVFVEISLDNFQTVAGRYRFHEEITTNNSSSNPDFVSIDISSSAGNQSNVYFRFMYEGEWDYAIMIDDVSFSETSNNEILLNNVTYGGWWIAYANSGGYGSDFTFNPLDQLTAMPYRFEGSIANTGVMTQNNVVMNVDVEDAQGMMLSNHTSSPISLSMGAADTVATTTNFTPTSYGIHNFNFYASSDSFPTTDTVTRSAIVTDTVYGVDFDWNSDGANAGGGYFLGRSCGGQVLGNVFDIFAPTYATSITFFVDDESVVGAEVTAQLYEVDPSQSIANAPPLLLNESDPYTLTGPDIGNWKTLKLQSTAPISLFPGSSYLAAVKGSQHPLDTSMISSNNNQNSASYLQNNCPDANGNVGSWGGLASAPMIRLNINGNNSSSILGCMDSLACNYDTLANINDPLSCIYISNPVVDLTMGQWIMEGHPFCDSVSVDIWYMNYSSDGTLIYSVDPFLSNPWSGLWSLCGNNYIETDATGMGYWYTGTYSNGIFSGTNDNNLGCWIMYPNLGCTDSTAVNYNPLITVDDGSCIFSQSDCSNLFISEYVEGPGQNNAIEIYNPTNSVIDLSGYSIKRYANGSTSASAVNTFALSGLINPGDVIVVGNGQVDSVWVGTYWSLPVDVAFFSMLDDYCNGDYNTNQTFYFNGNDAITLEYNGTLVVDIFGKVGENPGSAWTDDASAGYTDANGGAWWTKSQTLIRKSDVKKGVIQNPILFNPTLEYDSLPNATYSELGSHICDCFTTVINGCTDSSAINYNSLANIDDSSCVYCSLNYNISIMAPSTPFSCDGFVFVSNLTSTLPVTYDWYDLTTNSLMQTGNNFINNLCAGVYYLIVQDSIGCRKVDTFVVGNIYGCTDSLAMNYNGFSNFDDGSCLYYGCTDSLAINYDSTANSDDGSCLFCDLNVNLIVNQNTSNNICDGWIFSIATSSNIPINYLWSNGSASNSILSLCNGSYWVLITDSIGCEFIDTVLIGQNIYGCTDSTALNYNPLANVDDGSCIAAVLGCTDPTALNYNPLANVDNGSCCYISGCTDPSAINYDPNACYDDGSCIISNTCNKPTPTGLYVIDIIHNRARVKWDNMSSVSCTPEQYRVQYRVQGTNAWSTKNAVNTSNCGPFNQTGRLLTNLLPGTIYEYRVKVWYCNTTGSSTWSALQTFTTLDACPNVGNFAVTTPLTTRAVFTWDDSNGPYSFVRIKLRVDSISNPSGSDWQNAGGFGVNYGTWTRNKNGLVAGETYRGQSRTWCDPNGGPYKSANWTPLIFWTQPTSVRMGEEYGISNLDVYPNPSRDIFNISFTSEEEQDFTLRVVNLLGEEVVKEDMQQYVGEYVKTVNLNQYKKGIYLLEIILNKGTINKKLILQ